MTAAVSDTQSSAQPSAWSPLSLPVFRALWIATLASNVGTWMHDVGAGWLMASLTESPTMVALVQTATTLPVFLLAIPAGALSDIVDRRRYLIAIQCWMAAVAALLCWVVATGVVTPWILVAMTFGMGLGTALMLPAWAAITPELVPKDYLQPAVALNSLGINVARAIGPALAGFIISFAGTEVVFALNAISYIGVIVVLYFWRRQATFSDLPSERFFGAMRAGLRFARHQSALQAAVIRGAGFFLFASASWALLPLIAKQLEGGGPGTFGLLVASIGGGAVAGAAFLPKLRARISRDALVAGATLVYAAVMILLTVLDQLAFLCIVMAISGAAWISVLSSLQVAAQMALPNWVRARGLAFFMTVFMGSMAFGSLAWGRVAEVSDIQTALISAGIGACVAVLLTWRWKLAGIEDIDLTPSMHWPAPVAHEEVDHDRGPVMVTIEYTVSPASTAEFLERMQVLGRSRRRDGAYRWEVFEHSEDKHKYVEVFCVASWLEHLRQHERVTEEERRVQEQIDALLEGRRVVNHYLAPLSLP